MKKRWNTHVAKANASKLHKSVFDTVRERFPGFTVNQEYPIEVFDENEKKHVLYLDFFIPEMNVGIECQGKQHFEPNSHFFSGKEEFEKAKKNDRLKAQWCEMNSIALVEIRYDDKVTTKLIEKKISKAL